MTKIYTRTGDDGTTGMADGSRVPKDSPLIEAIGDVDELNCCIGLVLAESISGAARAVLEAVQQDLFDIGAQLSSPAYTGISTSRIDWLESQLEHFNKDLPPLKEFILPGGGAASARCHLSRAVCRRAERHLIGWQRGGSDTTTVLTVYLNRLSDLLFVLCRVLAREAGQGETQWRSGR